MDATSPTPWAAWLGERLDEHGWTQAELSRRCGLRPGSTRVVISRDRISRWISGETERPEYDVLPLLAKVLGRPLDEVRTAAGYPLGPGEASVTEGNSRPEGEIDRRSVSELVEAGEAPLLSIDPEALRGLTDEQKETVIREAQEHALRTARLLRGER